jgi:hypothetical protein
VFTDNVADGSLGPAVLGSNPTVETRFTVHLRTPLGQPLTSIIRLIDQGLCQKGRFIGVPGKQSRTPPDNFSVRLGRQGGDASGPGNRANR